MSLDDGYEPPRGRSLGRWLVMSVIALLVAAAMVIGALGGLGVFSEPIPTPRPTPDARTAATPSSTADTDDLADDAAWWRIEPDAGGGFVQG